VASRRRPAGLPVGPKHADRSLRPALITAYPQIR